MHALNDDTKTASAFASSWNNLPEGSVYTKSQFEDWMEPLAPAEVEGRSVLELGCGNGSLAVHMMSWRPQDLTCVDLGDSVLAARKNLSQISESGWEVIQEDLTRFRRNGFDIVYCIGVLHHLSDPRKGFEAVVSNVKPGGRFHCWVYAKEGNWVIRCLVDPVRRVTSKLPWWFTKHVVATLLVIPYFFYAKLIRLCSRSSLLKNWPLFEYSCWIAKREFGFFRHVAFDQLVTPRTVYVERVAIEAWLGDDRRIDAESAYIIRRNGNSWKFGGRVNENTAD